MINVLAMPFKVKAMQKQVMSALYSRHSYEDVGHRTLLKYTGQNIMEHKEYITEVCNSGFIRGCFNIIKKIGGCPELTIEDFDRFTNYVKDGGLESMWFMLKSDDKEQAFVDELDRLPKRVRDNAHAMLTKARSLHEDFVSDYFIKHYPKFIPNILVEHFNDTNAFLDNLVGLALHEQQLEEVVEAVEKEGIGSFVGFKCNGCHKPFFAINNTLEADIYNEDEIVKYEREGYTLEPISNYTVRTSGNWCDCKEVV